MSILTSALNSFSKSLFPNRCALCGEVIEINQKVCAQCENPPTIKPPLCEYCGSSKEDCRCKKHKNEYKQIVAPYYYDGSLVTAVHRFKNSDMPFLVNRLGDDVYNCINENYAEISFDAVAYVPLREFHQRVRGFNQSELLVEYIADKMNMPVLPALEKVRYTGVQHHKSAADRKADVFGSYDVADEYKNQLDGKIILLVDDVKTTGSTLNECAKMLKIYGAKSVYCAAIAITNRTK